jgi:hypothetical protein
MLLFAPQAGAAAGGLNPKLVQASSVGEKQGAQPQARIAPSYSRHPFWDGTSLGLGIVFDSLNEATRNDRSKDGSELAFSSPDPGISFSLDQNIRKIFSGGLTGTLATWQMGETEKRLDERLLVLSFLSHAEFLPPLEGVLGDTVGGIFRPYVSLGFGYFRFLKISSDSIQYKAGLQGESQYSLGAGLRLVAANRMALRLGIQQWHGIQTEKFGGRTVVLELMFGDLKRR